MTPPSVSSSSAAGCRGDIVTSPDELQTPCAYYLLTWGGEGSAAAAAPSGGNTKKKTADDDDDFDLFGEASEADKAKAKELAEAKKAEATKKKKKELIEKSSLVIDVKPGGADTDLDKVLELVRRIEMEGLSWNQASKKVPVAFGLYKLQVVCTIEDAKVNTNELVEQIEMLGLDEEGVKKRREAEDKDDDDDDDDAEGEEEEETPYLVQSAEIVSFSKL